MEVGAIEVTSTAGLVRKTSPGGTVPVPLGQGTLQVTVRRLFPDPGAVRVRTEPTEGAAEAIPWKVERQEPPASDALAFRLHGGRPGPVGIVLEGPGRDPVRFTLDVTAVPLVLFIDRGQVLRLAVGERFVLDMDLRGWHQVTVSLTDPSVLRLLGERDEGRPQVYLTGGNMHVHHQYEAVRPGRTTLQVDAVAHRETRRPDINFVLDIEVR